MEQIDTLYWESGAQQEDNEGADAELDADRDPNVLYREDDLTLDENIAKLPPTWHERGSNITSDDYLSSVSHLQDLSAQRLALQNKLNTYRTLLALLEPYRQPKENIQPNLVWKDTPLAPELMKTRTLAIRVAGRMGERFGDVQVAATAQDEDEDVDMAELDSTNGNRQKVAKVLKEW